MKPILITITLLLGCMLPGVGQTNSEKSSNTPEWTEADRKYLLENLIRTKEALIEETKNLTTEQWNFKESPDRWSINQIVEHIAIYELIFMNQISVSLQIGPFPDMKHYAPDSVFLDQDPMDLKKNNTTDYTKPFSITVPLGNNDGADNLIWLIKMLNESIEFVKSEKRNLRLYYINFGPNIHQQCIAIFAHGDRHLRQIKRVKMHADYPKD